MSKHEQIKELQEKLNKINSIISQAQQEGLKTIGRIELLEEQLKEEAGATEPEKLKETTKKAVKKAD